jgi:hypothetical protein
MGLFREEGGECEIVREVKMDVLGDFLRVRMLLVPRSVFYAAFFPIFAIFLKAEAFKAYHVQPLAVWPPVILGLASVAFWYEAINAWGAAPAA